MARRVGGGGWGDYFKYFHQRGGRLIEGRLLFENIRYLSVILCGFRKEQILSIIPDHPGGGGGGGGGRKRPHNCYSEPGWAILGPWVKFRALLVDADMKENKKQEQRRDR